MENELLAALNQNLVLLLLVELSTESYGRKRLSLATGKDCRTVSTRQVVYLAPNRTNLVGATTIETLTLVENHITHSLLLHVVVEVLVDKWSLLLELLLGKASSKLSLQSVEGLSTLVLHSTAGSDSVSLVVELRDDSLTKLLVVSLVAVLALNILAKLLHKLDLHGAVLLNLLVSEHNSAEHYLLRHLVHLTLDHKDVVDSTTDHNVEVGTLHSLETRVNDVLAIYTSYAHL